MRPTEKIIKRISALEDQIFSGPVKPMNLIETAEYLGLSPSYIYKLTYKKQIPHYKPTGKRIFFFKREIDEWIVKSSVDFSVLNDELKEKIKNSGSAVRHGSRQASISSGFGIKKEELKNGASSPLGTKDPNQIEMELNEKKDKRTGAK